MSTKVFCIGFPKTGTTSLQLALEQLGYRVTGPNGCRDPEIANKVLDMARELVPLFDAFQDAPWPVLYRELDEWYPGSKFILTVRDPDSWIRSQVRHFGEKSTPMREWYYGVGHPTGNEALYLTRYEQHNRDVREYFRNRPDDLLVLDLAAGDGWEQLCPFLGREVPAVPFPRANTAAVRERGNRWWRRTARRLIPRSWRQAFRRLVPRQP